MNTENSDSGGNDDGTAFGTAPPPLALMHLAAYPGLPLAGYLLAAGATGWPPGHDALIRVGIVAALLAAAAVAAARAKHNTVRAVLLGIAVGLSCAAGAAAAPLSGTIAPLLPAAAAAPACAVYAAILWYRLGSRAPAAGPVPTWLPLAIAAPLSIAAAIRALLWGGAGWGITAVTVYLAIWITFRTGYFCRAAARRPTRPVIEQACSEMLRGLILIEASLVTGFVDGPAAVAGVVFPFVVMPVAGMLSPWKIKYRK